MEDKLLIFISEGTLCALEVYDDNNCEFVSLEGNSYMDYTELRDIDRFIQYIKDSYNTDGLETLAMSTIIVNCGAEAVNVDALYESFTFAKYKNMVNIINILPIVAVAKNLISTEVINLEFMGGKYKISSNENDFLMCEPCDDSDDAFRIKPEYFSVLYNLDINTLTNHDAIQKIKNEKNALVCEYEERIETIRTELDEVAKSKAHLEILLLCCKKQIEEMEKDKGRVVCTVSESSLVQLSVPEGVRKTDFNKIIKDVGKLFSSVEFEVNKRLNEGTSVKKGESICTLKVDTDFLRAQTRFIVPFAPVVNEIVRNFGLFPVYDVVAPKDGKVFYLVNNDERVSKGKAIAIIGNNEDTEKEVMDWYARTLR